MDIIRINPKSPDKNLIKKAAAIILAGGVVVYPTDTAYGLAADAMNEHAIGKLFIIKQRVQKPLPIIVSDLQMLSRVAKVSAAEKKLIDKHWPGALTIIFEKKKEIQPFLTLGLPTIGVRIPDYEVARELVKVCDTPLTSTSANVTGQGNCYTPECVSRMFQSRDSQPDLILDAGELPEVAVSTVVQVEAGKAKVLRKGPVKIN